ncbi:hypothetical protein M758_6G126800 [Ceratodon purpureus]|uniref:Uncharacterized protein n=1 Tax=Ceratodon purpureus TaxID=3225 RepID=A0A8T0HH18_CERPU|nr:hypothetical protein KC19_6G132000 [Ceratodon purpureus]KAG0613742.1 hypothetical protein M758_6G126800 [Ceratodon purpureus]
MTAWGPRPSPLHEAFPLEAVSQILVSIFRASPLRCSENQRTHFWCDRLPSSCSLRQEFVKDELLQPGTARGSPSSPVCSSGLSSSGLPTARISSAGRLSTTRIPPAAVPPSAAVSAPGAEQEPEFL